MILGRWDHVPTVCHLMAPGQAENPDIATLESWFTSPEYQAHSALRDSVGEMQFVAYEAPAA